MKYDGVYVEKDDWDFWQEVGIGCSGYDSDGDLHLINVFKETAKNNNWYEDIAKRLMLDINYVRLLIEILCSAGFCEYGTSPRGAWAIQWEYENNIRKLEKWYKDKWES